MRGRALRGRALFVSSGHPATPKRPEREDQQRERDKGERAADVVSVHSRSPEVHVRVSLAALLALVEDQEDAIQAEERGDDETDEPRKRLHGLSLRRCPSSPLWSSRGLQTA
jgi:hypothetical protein